jgi:hypothetical protein
MRVIRLKPRLLRSAVLVLTALAFASYVSLGHGLHAPNDGMKSMHGEGICLVIFALAAAIALKRAVKQLPPPLATVLLLVVPPAHIPARPLLLGARASPIWLQRFLR